jgi:NADH-quinone oxidoreductase subunit D
LTLDGEIMTSAEPVIGYLHRGTEKLAEKLNYTQIIPYTDRLDYLSSMTNNYALVHAVETLMQIEIPEYTDYLRVIVMELQRLASHYTWWGTFLLDLGALSPFLYAFKDREQILDLMSELTGARMTYNYMRVGGVKWDAPEGWYRKVSDYIDYMDKELKTYDQLVTGNEIFIGRVKDIAAYDQKTAIDYGLSGANLRCTGLDWDIRKVKPYSVYDRLTFDVPVGTTGDCLDRYNVRMAEMHQSISIIRQCLKQMPSTGPICAKMPKAIRPPAGEVYTSIEAPRGELGVHLVSKGKAEPYRLKLRRPSFTNLMILPELLVGEAMSNVVAILGAVDIVLGEVDG